MKSRPLGQATLAIDKAGRSGLSGTLTLGSRSVPVQGRVKPGSPATVSLAEYDKSGKELASGSAALLFIPPWWPEVDYEYDLIVGTMVIGKKSALAGESSERLVTVTGIQPFEE